jgi:Sec-independent protein translocase protein TatA
MGRSLGKGMREFKSSIQGKDDDDRQALPAPTTTSTPSHDEPVSSRDRDSVV